MFIWLIKNYFKLRTFMNIQFFSDDLLWKVDYKISYPLLSEKQKGLSDEFTRRLRVCDLGK